MFRHCIWLCVFAVGCESNAPSVADPKATEFKEAAAKFLEEVRGIATEMDQNLTADEAQKLADKVQELHAHLPEVPPPFSKDSELVANLKELPKAAAWNALVTKNEDDAIEAGKQVDDRNSPKAANVLRDLCTKIENAIHSKK